MLHVARMFNDVRLPQKENLGDAGYDVFAYTFNDIVIPVNSRRLIPTGIIMSVCGGYYLRIAPRSGNAVKGIDVGAGVVDSTYRGEVKVLLINNTDSPLVVHNGMKIAQIIVTPCYTGTAIIEEKMSEIQQTTRGDKGFGSSGSNV